jgi:hypothetical protein
MKPMVLTIGPCNQDDCVLKGRSISILFGLLLKNCFVSSRRMVVYDLPVVETTGCITLSLRDRGKVNVRIMETTELNIMKNPACLGILSRHSFFA